MKRHSCFFARLLMMFALILPWDNAAPPIALRQVKSSMEGAEAGLIFGQMPGRWPLLFIQNQGQLDSRVAYYLQGQQTSVYFTPEGLTFALTTSGPETSPAGTARFVPFAKNPQTLTNSITSASASRWVLKLDFVGANPNVLPAAEERAETTISYFQGSPGRWHTALPTFHRLVYRDLWPGIDLVYAGTGNQLKYEFVVQPGADPGNIRLAYRGANRLTLDQAGQMVVTTPAGSLLDEAPLAYQVTVDGQVPVAVSYVLEDAAAGPDSEDSRPYSFHISAYNPALPLIIDPAVLANSGYIGGSREDVGQDIVVDERGAAYITGYTYSNQASFPVNSGPDEYFNGASDAFVAKLWPDGSGFVYIGYIGGSGDDAGFGIAVDRLGAAYITGQTSSDESTFPVAVGPDLTFNGSDSVNMDAFVVKVRSDGSELVYAGYIGGISVDRGSDIAVDAKGTAYVVGSTTSDERNFPVTVGPDLTCNGQMEAFVAGVRPDGSGLVYAGYIGGGLQDFGFSIALDKDGAAYVTGSTESEQHTFPVTVGPDLTHSDCPAFPILFGCNYDAFVAKIRPDGSGLVYAGYIGGSTGDGGSGIAVDHTGAAYIIGITNSDQRTFPVSVGPDLMFNVSADDLCKSQVDILCPYDSFVAKVRPDGTGLVYAGYIGGVDRDMGNAITVDELGAAYITGATSSDQATFPAHGGPDSIYHGEEDAFVTKVRPDGSGLVYAGYIGGSGDDVGFGIALSKNGDVTITGRTSSDQASFPVNVGPDLTHNGDQDAFVTRILEVTTSLYLPQVHLTK